MSLFMFSLCICIHTLIQYLQNEYSPSFPWMFDALFTSLLIYLDGTVGSFNYTLYVEYISRFMKLISGTLCLL
jgi:hypothetical protein